MKEATLRRALALSVCVCVVASLGGREHSKAAPRSTTDRLVVAGERLADEVTSWGQRIERRSIDADWGHLFSKEERAVDDEDASGFRYLHTPVRALLVERPDAGLLEFELASLRLNWYVTRYVSGTPVRRYSAWVRAESADSTLLLTLRGGGGPSEPWTVAGGSVWGAGLEWSIEGGSRGAILHSPYDSGEPDNDVTGPGQVVEMPAMQRVLAQRDRVEAVPAPGTVLRVMAVGTSGVPQTALDDYIDLQLQDLKDAFANSSGQGVGAQGVTAVTDVAHVATLMSSYAQTGSASADIAAVRGLPEVLAARASSGADLVVLVVPQPYPACGAAWNPDWISVVVLPVGETCSSSRAVVHEIGHNLGAAHEAGDSMSSTPGYPDSRAYQSSGRCDVMFAASLSCRQLMFSTPERFFPGDPAGVLAGSSSAFNARVVSDFVVHAACYGPVHATGGGFSPVSPVRVFDSRNGTGGYSTPWTPLAERRVRVDVPSVPGDATAVLVNIAAVDAVSNGYLTAYRCGESPPNPITSTLNFSPGYARSTTTIVQLGEYKFFSLKASTQVHVTVDVLGYFGGTGAAQNNKLHPVGAPVRVLTTADGGGSPLSPGVVRKLSVAGQSPPAGASTAVMNLSSFQASGNGNLTVTPGVLNTANLNFTASRALGNLVFVPVSWNAQFCDPVAAPCVEVMARQASTHLAVDLYGWLGPNGQFSFSPAVPQRVISDVPVGGGGSTPLYGVSPPGAAGLFVNLAGANATASTFLVVYGAAPVPPIASLNAVSGSATSNHAIVKPFNGGVRVYNHNGTISVFLDVIGYWS